MNFTDIMLDLNDFWGRVVPGFLLLLNLSIMINGVETFNPSIIFDPDSNMLLNKEYPTFLVVLMATFFSYILGEISLWPIFRLRNILIHSKSEWFIKMDSTRDILVEKVSCPEDIVKYFNEHFSREHLTNPGSKVFKYCKSYLQNHCPDSYVQAKRNEARTNLHGGLIIPMVITLILMSHMEFFTTRDNIAFLVIPLLLILFHYSSFFIRWPEKEHLFVYLAYYWCSHQNDKTYFSQSLSE